MKLTNQWVICYKQINFCYIQMIKILGDRFVSLYWSISVHLWKSVSFSLTCKFLWLSLKITNFKRAMQLFKVMECSVYHLLAAGILGLILLFWYFLCGEKRIWRDFCLSWSWKLWHITIVHTCFLFQFFLFLFIY